MFGTEPPIRPADQWRCQLRDNSAGGQVNQLPEQCAFALVRDKMDNGISAWGAQDRIK